MIEPYVGAKVRLLNTEKWTLWDRAKENFARDADGEYLSDILIEKGTEGILVHKSEKHEAWIIEFPVR
jgi:hypothetical protein